MFKSDDIDRHMHCIMQNLKKNAQVRIYFLSDQNIGHCVELTFFLSSGFSREMLSSLRGVFGLEV